MHSATELIEEFRKGAQGCADIDTESIMWAIVEDIRDSYRLAMSVEGVSLSQALQVELTVSDYISNNYEED